MKILIICTSIDNYLKRQIEALQEINNHSVDMLNIIEYKMKFDNGKTIHIRPKTKFKILEHFFISDEINEHYRRRELFEYLDRYDIVHIYKCSQYAIDIKDKIESISLKYVVTINDVIPRKSSKLEELFRDAKAIFFQNDRFKQSFNYIYGFEKHSKTLYEPVELIHIYENIDSKVLDKFIEYLKISPDKINIFCHFQGSKNKQQELIISLANLPIEVKKASTFFLYLNNEDEAINNNLIQMLKQIKLDYVIINQSATKEQLAMLLKISSASIFINHSPLNSILITSIYAKNHPFLYKPKELDYIFQKEKIFLDNFSEFYFFFDKDEINEGLFKEIYKRNKEIIHKLFSYKSFEESYIKATLR
jgi:hypothetical protein